MYCNRSCLSVCVFATGGRAVSEPYYSQRAQCLRLSERCFSVILRLLTSIYESETTSRIENYLEN